MSTTRFEPGRYGWLLGSRSIGSQAELLAIVELVAVGVIERALAAPGVGLEGIAEIVAVGVFALRIAAVVDLEAVREAVAVRGERVGTDRVDLATVVEPAADSAPSTGPITAAMTTTAASWPRLIRVMSPLSAADDPAPIVVPAASTARP